MGKLFRAYAINGDILESNREAFLDLPASPYEILDALDKLRLTEGSGVKFRIEEYYRFDCLAEHLSGEYALPELNVLAEKLSELDGCQEIAFHGLLATHKAEEPMDLSGVIDMAYSSDCCHVVGEALNDSQLGRFCAENGFVPGAESLPEELFELLDFERIGREHRFEAGGVFIRRTADHPGGYVEPCGELAEAYKTLDFTPEIPDYAVLLEESRGFFDDPGYDSEQTVQLKLPASPETLDAALTALAVWDWREAGWRCLDCRAPHLMDMLSDMDDIHAVNHLAQRLADMDPKTLIAYKSLLAAVECKIFCHAEQLMDTLDKYMFSHSTAPPLK